MSLRSFLCLGTATSRSPDVSIMLFLTRSILKLALERLRFSPEPADYLTDECLFECEEANNFMDCLLFLVKVLPALMTRSNWVMMLSEEATGSVGSFLTGRAFNFCELRWASGKERNFVWLSLFFFYDGLQLY